MHVIHVKHVITCMFDYKAAMKKLYMFIVQVQINKHTSKHEEGRQRTSNFLSWLKMQMIDQPKAWDTNTDKDDMHIH